MGNTWFGGSGGSGWQYESTPVGVSSQRAGGSGNSGGSMEGTDWVMYAIMAASAAAQMLAGYLMGQPGNVAYTGNKADKFVKWLGPKLMAGLPDDAIEKLFKPVELNFAEMNQRKSVGLVMPHSGGMIPGGAGLVKETAGGYAGGAPAGPPAGPPAGGAVGGGPQAQPVAFTGGGAQGGFQGGFQGGGFQGGGAQGGAQGGVHPDLPKVLQLIDTIQKRGYLPTGRNSGFQGGGGGQMV